MSTFCGPVQSESFFLFFIVCYTCKTYCLVHSFCQQASVKIKEADYILVHHQNSRYENAAQEMNGLLWVNHTQLRSIRCREGVFRRI